ncbi:hypothetical protein J6590_027057 [Homalodisca vitripennis]|nr:hypothetical protein J6590_027057 [Homalodisca vitripennis]
MEEISTDRASNMLVYMWILSTETITMGTMEEISTDLQKQLQWERWKKNLQTVPVIPVQSSYLRGLYRTKSPEGKGSDADSSLHKPHIKLRLSKPAMSLPPDS